MPIYEYNCPVCQQTFEEWLRSNEAAPTRPCPECGANAERIISNSTFILKGSGWYVTEYGNQKDADLPAEINGAKASGSKDNEVTSKKPAVDSAVKTTNTPASSDVVAPSPATQPVLPGKPDSAQAAVGI